LKVINIKKDKLLMVAVLMVNQIVIKS